MTRCALAIAGRQASGLWLVRAGAAWRKPGKNRYGARRSECRQRKRCVTLGWLDPMRRASGNDTQLLYAADGHLLSRRPEQTPPLVIAFRPRRLDI